MGLGPREVALCFLNLCPGSFISSKATFTQPRSSSTSPEKGHSQKMGTKADMLQMRGKWLVAYIKGTDQRALLGVLLHICYILHRRIMCLKKIYNGPRSHAIEKKKREGIQAQRFCGGVEYRKDSGGKTREGVRGAGEHGGRMKLRKQAGGWI